MNAVRITSLWPLILSLSIAGCSADKQGARGMMAQETDEQRKLDQTLNEATVVFRRFTDKRPGELPLDRIRNERACIAVVPEFTSTALVVGAAGGRGVVSCKSAGAASEWSAPAFFTMSDRSLGAQLGRQSSSIVAYTIGEDAGRNFARGDTFKLGSGLGVTAGGMGGDVGVSARQGRTYVMNQQGAFLGLSLSGSSITPDEEAIERYYGSDVSVDEILYEGEVAMPAAAQTFTSVLPHV